MFEHSRVTHNTKRLVDELSVAQVQGRIRCGLFWRSMRRFVAPDIPQIWLCCLVKPNTDTGLLLNLSTGTYLFLDADIEATVSYVKECAQKARASWVAATRIRDYVEGAIDKFQPQGAGTVFVLLTASEQLVVPSHCIIV